MRQKSSSRYQSLLKLLLLSVVLLVPVGCATVAWYGQAARGQMEILAKREDIAELIADADTPPVLRQRLRTVLEIRRFAVERLGLPEGRSYTLYADLDRKAPLWNVVAAPEDSVRPQTWCYPLVGCVAYRGFFRHRQAATLAAELRAQGLDVAVYPATGYSTLGWFADPVLDSMLELSEPDLAELIFHELSHELLYVRGDAAFSEAFATFVGRLGVQLWLTQRGDHDGLRRWRESRQLEERLTAALLAARERLDRAYRESADPVGLTAVRLREFERLKREIRELDSDEERRSLRGWLATDLNNAHLALVATYESGVAAFESFHREQCDRDLGCLFEHARDLARADARRRVDFLQGAH